MPCIPVYRSTCAVLGLNRYVLTFINTCLRLRNVIYYLGHTVLIDKPFKSRTIVDTQWVPVLAAPAMQTTRRSKQRLYGIIGA